MFLQTIGEAEPHTAKWIQYNGQRGFKPSIYLIFWKVKLEKHRHFQGLLVNICIVVHFKVCSHDLDKGGNQINISKG